MKLSQRVVECLIAGAAGLLPAAAYAQSVTPVSAEDVRVERSTPVFTGETVVRSRFVPEHLFDASAFTNWVASGGVGVQLDLAFAGTRYVSSVTILPGCAGSNRTFDEFSRPKTIELEADGKTVSLQIQDRRRAQEIPVHPPLPARSLSVVVKEIYGGKLPGVCITDLIFHERADLARVSEAERERIEGLVASFSDPAKVDDAVKEVIAAGPAAVSRLELALQGSDRAVQMAALRAYKGLGVPAAAPALLAFWTRGPAPELRAITLEALANCGNGKALPVLAAMMTDADLSAADAAAKSIGQYGKAAVPLLARLLDSPHEDVQARVLKALAGTRDPRAVALAIPFTKARHSSVRAAAARAVAGARNAEAAAILAKLASDPHPVVRVAVAKGLRDMPGDEATQILADLMRDGDEFVARVAIARAARRHDGDRQLAIYLGEPTAPHGELAISLLAHHRSPSSLRFMLDALRRGEARYRLALREAIGAYGVSGMQAIALAALEDDRLRADAEAILGAGGSAAIPVLARALDKAGDNPPIFLVRALGASQAVDAIPLLDRVWSRGLLSLQIETLAAYARFPAALVSGRILAGLEASDLEVRAAAAAAAGQAGVVQAAPLLVEALKRSFAQGDDPLAIPKTKLIEALAKLRDVSAESEIVGAFWSHDARLDVRLAVMRACQTLETAGCIDLLGRAGSHPNAEVRAAAHRLLSAEVE